MVYVASLLVHSVCHGQVFLFSWPQLFMMNQKYENVYKKPSVKVHGKSLVLAVKLNVTRCENTSSVFVGHQTLHFQ